MIPKTDVIISLKLGLLFQKRSEESRSAFDARSDALFKYSLDILRLRYTGRSPVEPVQRLFNYIAGNSSSSVDKEINRLAEEAIKFIVGRHFNNHEYDDCIHNLAGIKLPFATYFQAEAYRKKINPKISKKDRRECLEKARDFLTQTVELLKSSIYESHPLKSLAVAAIENVERESRILETSFNDSFVSASNNSRNDYYDFDEAITPRQRRDVAVVNNNENVEKLIREMMSSLSLLKDEMSALRADVVDTRDRVQSIEEQLQKKSTSQTDAASVDPLEDYYLLEEDLQQAGLLNNTSMFNNVSRLNSTNQSQMNSFQQQPFGISQDVAAAAAAFNINPGLYRGMLLLS